MKCLLLLCLVFLTSCASDYTVSTNEKNKDIYRHIKPEVASVNKQGISCLPERKISNMTEGVVGPRNIQTLLNDISTPEFHQMLKAEYDKNSCFSGELLVKAVITRFGNVRKITLLESTFEDAKFDSKVIQHISDIEFGLVNSDKETIAYIPVIWKRR